MTTNPRLRNAVRLALVSSSLAAAGVYAGPAFSQQSGTQDSTSQDQQQLQEIVVTGSRIRRVDSETANPVLVVSRQEIDASGATSMGEFMQQIPVVAGAATNPANNNGGGDGASTIELRGLGDERTLVLLNGHRLSGIAGNGAADINIIPVNLIQRVDVLKEGAGATYGSDAIAGVVNFVTRTDLDGMELSYDTGESSRSDGRRQSVGIAWGTKGERGNVIMGLNWQKQDQISAGNRKFSKTALYLYGEYGVYEGGSSRTPTGRIFLNDTLAAQFGCSSVTKSGGDGTSLGDYRCFNFATDHYNYQPLNLIMTPSERGSLFTAANYEVNDNIEVYTQLLHNYTNSGAQIAALPFDSFYDDVVISANNYYNPFGIDFGGISGVNPDAMWRTLALGNRAYNFETSTDLVTLGARGQIMDTSWNWDLSGNYETVNQHNHVGGYYLSNRMKAAVGPSFLDPNTNTVVCGTPGNIISACTPLNIFNINDPSQAAVLDTIKASYNQATWFKYKNAELNLTGDIYDLPAGTMKAAVGGGYTKYDYKFTTDTLTVLQPPDYLTCGLSQETCTSNTNGNYDLKSVYAEVFVPILADMPGVKALNVTLGSQYTDYSTFGNTTNSSVKLEWRPISDLLIRGTWAQVFRAPQISDLYSGQSANAPTFTDPCVGLTQAMVDANPNLALACQNVPRDGTFSQPNGQITGIFGGNPDLKPESGHVITGGFVWQPEFLDGFSFNGDWWSYKLNNIITYLDVNYTANTCVQTGDPAFCDLIVRSVSGAIIKIDQPTTNLGTLDTSGFDFGFKYLLADTRFGSYRFSLDTTYINKYDSKACAACNVVHVAGSYDRQYGNIAKWRGLASIGWAYDPFTAVLSARYVGDAVLHDPDGAPGIQPDLKIPSKTYLDLTVGYNWNKQLQVNLGVNNLGDVQPPILYQNNVINANTDVATYDTVGRYYRLSLKYKF